jgi:hypothetical protein
MKTVLRGKELFEGQRYFFRIVQPTFQSQNTYTMRANFSKMEFVRGEYRVLLKKCDEESQTLSIPVHWILGASSLEDFISEMPVDVLRIIDNYF